MKKSILITTLLVFGWAGISSAVPMTWTDTIDFDDVMVPPTFDYYHDISDDGFSSVWTGGDDTITGFELEVALYDDNMDNTSQELQIVDWKWIFPVFDWVTVTTPDGGEGALVSFGLESKDYSFVNGSETYTGNLFGAIDIWHDGTLNVSISSTGGDFYVDSSKLVVSGDDGTSPVPEPATALLLGTGLAGLAMYRRKRTK